MTRGHILWELPYKEGLKLIHAILIADGAHVKWLVPREEDSKGLLEQIQDAKNRNSNI